VRQPLVSKTGKFKKEPVLIVLADIAAVDIDGVAEAQPYQTGIGRVAAAPIENPPTRGQIGRVEAEGLHGVVEKGRGTVLLQIGVVGGRGEVTLVDLC
jgi:hypothetical protein